MVEHLPGKCEALSSFTSMGVGEWADGVGWAGDGSRLKQQDMQLNNIFLVILLLCASGYTSLALVVRLAYLDYGASNSLL